MGTPKPRLTPAQLTKLRQVATWGDVFTCFYDYGFLIEKGLVETPSKTAIEKYYADLEEEQQKVLIRVNAIHYQLYTNWSVKCDKAALWKEMKSLADHGHSIQLELENRREDQERLVKLNMQARLLVFEADERDRRKDEARAKSCATNNPGA
jgi:hypothetical protein